MLTRHTMTLDRPPAKGAHAAGSKYPKLLAILSIFAAEAPEIHQRRRLPVPQVIRHLFRFAGTWRDVFGIEFGRQMSG